MALQVWQQDGAHVIGCISLLILLISSHPPLWRLSSAFLGIFRLLLGLLSPHCTWNLTVDFAAAFHTLLRLPLPGFVQLMPA